MRIPSDKQIEYLFEANDEQVDEFFDGECSTLYQWTEGEGRATTNMTIYSNGDSSICLLELEYFGFNDYVSRYDFVRILNVTNICTSSI